MTDLLLLVLLSLVLQNVDLLTLTVLQHLAGDGCTLNDGSTDLEACLGGQSGYGESNLCALFDIQLLDKNDVLLDDLVLLSACSDNSKHEKHLFS